MNSIWKSVRLFYDPLHLIEIFLRNQCHKAFGLYLKDSEWLKNNQTHSILRSHEIRLINQKIEELRKKKDNFTENDIISNLMFGFWTQLYDNHYKEIHIKTIHIQLPFSTPRDRNLKELRIRLNGIRLIRNRIFHYEPIWYKENLRDIFEQCWSIIKSIQNSHLFVLELEEKSRNKFEELMTRQEEMKQ